MTTSEPRSIALGDAEPSGKAKSSHTAPCRWLLLDEASDADQKAWRKGIQDLLGQHPRATLDHDPDWLALRASQSGRRTYLYVGLGQGDRLVGYAPFFAHPSSLSFSLAGRSLFTLPVQRLTITASALLVDENTDGARDAVQSLMRVLRTSLARGQVLFVLGLHRNSLMGELGEQQAASGFLMIPHGPAYERRFARVEPSLDAYLALLSAKTRADLRRHERMLHRHVEGAIELMVAHRAEDVGSLLEAVESVSRRTYQWHLHGIGIRNSGDTRDLLERSAQRGWLRCYVLRCRGQPVAFMVGYLYNGVYLSESIGYDPDWAHWSVGNVLHLFVMRDLATLGARAQWFDFLYGDNSNKRRLATRAHWERNVYLVPDSLRWRIVVPLLRGFDRATEALSALAERYSLKTKLRRLMRRRSVQSGNAGAKPKDET